MKQSWFVYMGLFDLLLVAGFVGLFGPRSVLVSVVPAAMMLAGVSALVAGSVARLSVGPVSVSWRYFVALTYALLALILPVNSLPHIFAGTATGAEWLLFVVGIVGGLSLLFTGIDIARDGRHFSVETDVERTVELG